MVAGILSRIWNRPPRRRRFRGLESGTFEGTSVSFAATNTLFELENRYGIREMQAHEWSLLLTTISCSVSLGCAILALPLPMVPGGSPFIPLLLVGFICNRMAVSNALKLFRGIQLAVTDSRNRRPAGWTRHVIGLFPFSVWVPPGDLVSAAALLVFLRSTSDHLSTKQHRVFDRGTLALGIAFPIQYFYPTLVMAQLMFLLPWSSTPEKASLATCLAMTAGALWIIYASLRAMRQQLVELIQQTHWEVDPASEFMTTVALVEPEPQPGLPTSDNFLFDA